MSETLDRILKTAEAAKLLRVSETHLKKQAREGAIPGRKSGKLWRFSEARLIEYVRGDDNGSTSKS